MVEVFLKIILIKIMFVLIIIFVFHICNVKTVKKINLILFHQNEELATTVPKKTLTSQIAATRFPVQHPDLCIALIPYSWNQNPEQFLAAVATQLGASAVIS
jgi:hypothetical protein